MIPIFIRKNTVGIMSSTSFEYIELPSKGECYPMTSPLRDGRVKVAYLTAKDENIIVSKKHIEEATMCEALLSSTVKDANPNELCSGDKEAVVLWLYKTSYGNIYKNPQTGDAVDLDKVKYKEFHLISDDMGYFHYVMSDGKNVSFHYLPFIEEERQIGNAIERLKEENDEDATYEDVFRKMSVQLLKEMIVSVEGITDIEAWLSELDYTSLRELQRYITVNSAGLNIETTDGVVFDDSVFYNIMTNNGRRI